MWKTQELGLKKWHFIVCKYEEALYKNRWLTLTHLKEGKGIGWSFWTTDIRNVEKFADFENKHWNQGPKRDGF